MRSARNLQQLAVRLSQSGLQVLRFDYSGTGNSSGDDDQVSLDAWRSDIAAAVEFTRNARSFHLNKPSSVSVLGIRLGANLASSTPLSGIENVILWDPIVRGDRYIKLLRKYHHNELTSLTRYLSHRSSQPNQLLGYACSSALQESLESLFLWDEIEIQTQQRWVLSSQDYSELQSPDLKDIILKDTDAVQASWSHRSFTDEIFWDRHAFTNRAFSSPNISQSIVSILTKGTA